MVIASGLRTSKREGSTAAAPPACQTPSLPTSLAISVPRSKPDLRASMDLREPFSIMRSKCPSACERWTRPISSCFFYG